MDDEKHRSYHPGNANGELPMAMVSHKSWSNAVCQNLPPLNLVISHPCSQQPSRWALQISSLFQPTSDAILFIRISFPFLATARRCHTFPAALAILLAALVWPGCVPFFSGRVACAGSVRPSVRRGQPAVHTQGAVSRVACRQPSVVSGRHHAAH